MLSSKAVAFDLDDALDSLDLTFNGYRPSAEALEFFVLMRLVTGEDFEFDTPLVHYFIVDVLLGNIQESTHFPYSEEIRKNITINLTRVSIMMARGLGKSTVVTQFFPVYSAIKGEVGIWGKQYFYLGLAASAQGGGRVMSKAIQSMCEESEFCKEYFESMRFTETESEFVRKGPGKTENRAFLFRTMGVGTGSIRGVRSNYGSRRPDCHARGTTVTTEYGTHKVEDFPGVKSEGHFEIGNIVKLRGLPTEEIVSNGHKYWTKLCVGNKCVVENGKKLPRYSEHTPKFEEVQKLTDRHWIGERIDYTVEEVQPIEHIIKTDGANRDEKGRVYGTKYGTVFKVYKPMLHDEWWWLYGLWLADGTLGSAKIGREHRNNRGTVAWAVANTQRNTVGKKLTDILDKLGIHHAETVNGSGCYRVTICDATLADWLRAQKHGNSVKDMPNWVLRLSFAKQKQILLGYIAGDGYIDCKSKSSQVRINSVNYNVLRQLQTIASRLGLPSYIRNTKKAQTTYFSTSNKYHACRHQWELRLKDGCGEILGISEVIDSTRNKYKQVHIQDGFLWRQVKSVKKTDEAVEFIPIQCNSAVLENGVGDRHSYESEFGVSHNCIMFDDSVSNTAAAHSETQMRTFEETVHSDAINALKGGDKGRIVMVFTPFTYNDPNVKTITSGAFTPIVIPLCQGIDEDTKRSEFIGAWEDMHPYQAVKQQYVQAKKANMLRAFNQERMLRLASEDDRMVSDDMIQWYDRNLVMKMLDGYSLYMTTDFTTTSAAKSDFSALALWAVSSNNDYYLLDLCVRRHELQEQYNELFRMLSTWNKHGRMIEVGVEIDGQQKAHLFALKEMMIKKGIYFTFARQKGAPLSREGILSKSSGVSKLERFRYTLPVLQNKKMYFPEQLKNTPDMKEAIKQLKGVTYAGFSTHDDFIDVVSQLTMVDVLPGSGTVQEDEFKNDVSGIWGNPYEDEAQYGDNNLIF